MGWTAVCVEHGELPGLSRCCDGRAVTLRPATDGRRAGARRDPGHARGARAGGAAATTWPEIVRADLADDELTVYAIEHDGRVVGAIQWYAEADPDYRHASLDVFLDPAVHGRGLGRDAVRTLARPPGRRARLPPVDHRPGGGQRGGDPRVREGGFPAGRRACASYERGADGRWHDGLLMDLLAANWCR